MGCNGSRPDSKTMNVKEHWKNLKLPEVPAGTFENEFELIFYKTICLIRIDPRWIIPYVKNAKDNKHYTGANIEIVIN